MRYRAAFDRSAPFRREVATVTAAVVAVVSTWLTLGAEPASAKPLHPAPHVRAASSPITFTYQGATVQSWTVPAGIGFVQLQVVGGGGGENDTTHSWGSSGAQVEGLVNVTPGQRLLISAAGAGGEFDGGPGGWGGLGASGGAGRTEHDSLRNSGAGGGASTVQIQDAGTNPAPATTLIIAGGGGGEGGASGDPNHAGDGGNAGTGNSWTGGNGQHGTEGSLGGSGGTAGAQSSPAGQAARGGSGLGGDGGGGGGGARGGNSGGGAKGASAGGGGGAGSSWSDASVMNATVANCQNCNWGGTEPASPPTGWVRVTPLPRDNSSLGLFVQNTTIAQGGTTGPMTAVVADQPYQPTGTVQFTDVTDPSAPVDLGSAQIVNGVAAIAQANPTLQTTGVHQIQAQYSGDNHYQPADSSIVDITVTTADQRPGQARTAVMLDLAQYPPNAPSRSTASAATGDSGDPAVPTVIMTILLLTTATTVLYLRRRRLTH